MHMRSDIADMSRRLGPCALGVGAVIAMAMLVESDIARPFLLLYSIIVPLVALGYLLLRHLDRRAFNKVSERNYRICTGCGHDLAGLRNVGRCPECGRAYTQKLLQELWTHAHGEPTRFTLEAFSHLRTPPKMRPWLDIVSLMIMFVITAVLVSWFVRRVEADTFVISDCFWTFILPVGAIPSLFVGKHRDHLAYLVRNRFRHCPRCHVRLPKRRASGICTTCRLPWDEKWLETTWRRVYAPPTDPASQEPTPT